MSGGANADHSSSFVPAELVNKCVVLDMASPYIFIGRLAGETHGQLILEDCDVHDMRDSKTTRELYVLDSRNYGVRANRKRVYVRLGDVVGISELTDVTS